ncbi:hypothetical protein CMUS01_09609 [Colletotrichum musicola]|uniref:Uncharacterized protein n=1 Tax=Colletotrichum musicola TaxID=2175873 RepID=A0A8H6NA52_9PEZI|nr:hypothetical protein CMUS01_09609 [Colletotrichum musicola]
MGEGGRHANANPNMHRKPRLLTGGASSEGNVTLHHRVADARHRHLPNHTRVTPPATYQMLGRTPVNARPPTARPVAALQAFSVACA